MAAKPRKRGGLLRLPLKVQLVLNLVLLVALFGLDLRDLLFKTHWVGPLDVFSFESIRHYSLDPHHAPALKASRNFSFAGQRAQRASGWSSFLQKCQSLQAMNPSQDFEFDHVLASNCELGRSGHSSIAQQLVAVSSLRVDSVAWAACKILYHHRKPQVCHSPIVKQFVERYNIDESVSQVSFASHDSQTPVITATQRPESYAVKPGSDAEMELMELLSLIGQSMPVEGIVCVEAFPVQGPGHYTSSIFGCASPNSYRSAFVGLHAPSIAQFLQDQAWLTSDVLHFMGMTFLVRGNSRSLFTVTESITLADDVVLTLDHVSQLNFSCSGALYAIMVVLDLTLMLLSISSALEIGRLMLLPLWKSVLSPECVPTKLGFAAEDCRTVLTASLYRSKPVIAMTLVSQSLSWMLVHASLVVWTQTHTQGGKTQAALSMARLWVVILLVCDGVWDRLVSLSEKRAFVFAKATYVSMTEVGVIGLLVAYCKRNDVLSMVKRKHATELQRLADASSFPGLVAVANTFPSKQQSLQNTSTPVLWILYQPLLEIVLLSALAVACAAIGRYAYFLVRYGEFVKNHHNSLLLLRKNANHSANKSLVRPDTSEEISLLAQDESNIDTLLSLSPVMMAPSPSPPPSPKRSRPEGVSASGNERDLRLPLESLVDIPIRASSLIRKSWVMEKKIGHQVFLRPPFYLEYGIILEAGSLKTRRGFLDVVHPFVSASDHLRESEPSELTAKQHGKRRALVPLH